jgi:hypothetical protein
MSPFCIYLFIIYFMMYLSERSQCFMQVTPKWQGFMITVLHVYLSSCMLKLPLGGQLGFCWIIHSPLPIFVPCNHWAHIN